MKRITTLFTFLVLVSYGANAVAIHPAAINESEIIETNQWQIGVFINYSFPLDRGINRLGRNLGIWYSIAGEDENTLFNKIAVYPSPFKDELNLKFEEGHGISDVYLYNLLGQLVIHKMVIQQAVTLTIPTEELADGVYLLEVRGYNGDNQVRRVVKR